MLELLKDMKNILMLVGILIIVIGIFGYAQRHSLKSLLSGTTQISSTATPITPTPAIDMSNWKTFTYSDGSFTIKYPPDWITGEGMTNGGAYAAQLFTPGGGLGANIGISKNAVFGSGCSNPNHPLHINGETLYGCYELNPNGSVEWGGYVKVLSPTKKFGIQIVSAYKNKTSLLLQILSTLTFK